MDKLIVDSDSLTTITIPAMKRHQESISTCYEDMKAAVQSLVDNGYMQSETAEAYVTEFTTLVAPDVQELCSMVGTYYTQLQQISDSFLQVDATMAGSLV